VCGQARKLEISVAANIPLPFPKRFSPKANTHNSVGTVTLT
jgi:hypothetical protein